MAYFLLNQAVEMTKNDETTKDVIDHMTLMLDGNWKLICYIHCDLGLSWQEENFFY